LLYDDFVLDVCLKHLDNVQSKILIAQKILFNFYLDSLKPTFCTFMGLYVVKHLKEAVINGTKSLQIFANDFCINAKDSVKERLLFLNDIYSLNTQSE
jgi:hypothetical protein